MKIGAKIAHFGMTPGMMMSITAVRNTNPTISGIGPSPAASSASARMTASTVAMLVKLKKAMNWAMISSRKIRPASPEYVLTTALIASTLPVIVFAPLP